MTWAPSYCRGQPIRLSFRLTPKILEARVLLNSPPVLTVPAAQSVAEGASISLIVSASDSDGDTLTFSASGLPAGLSINTTSGLISGYVGYNNASALFSPVAVSSTLNVSDGTYLVSGSLSWSVADTDRLPSVSSQSNVEGTSISLDAHGTDNTGTDTLSYSASNLPAGLSINASTGLISGVINYENASPGFPNSSVAHIQVSDQNLASDTRSFTWTVSDTNRLPNPGPLSNAEGQSVTLSMAGTDNVPGDTLTYSAFSLPTGLSINSSTGLVSGIPQYNDASAGLTASYTALVTALDNHFGSDSRTLTWTIADTDRFPSTSAATAVVGVSTSLSMAGTDTIGSDTLTYSATGLPAGLTMNSSTGLISGTPSLTDAIAGSVSLYTASLTLTDNHSGTDHQPLTWYITNPTFSWSMTPVAAPSVTNPGSQSSAEGAVISLAFHASDPNSYSLTYAALDLPGGLSVNSSTGVIAGTVNYQAAGYFGGTYAAQMIVVNGHGGAQSASFTWTISDTTLTPTVSSIATQSVDAGDSISLQVNISDADLNPLTYTASGLPSGLEIDPTAGLISGTIDRSAYSPTPYEATITVNDGASVSATQTFAMTVGVSNHPPTLDSVSNQTNSAGQCVDLILTAEDADNDALTYSASGLPAGLTLDPFSGEIAGTISNSAASSTAHTATLVVSDGQSAVSQSLQWTVNYVGLDSPGGQGNVVGDTVSLALAGHNGGGGPFAYGASGLPAGLTINTGSGLISGTLTTAAASSSPETVTLSANNGTNNASQTITWSVARLALNAPGDQYGSEGHTASLQLSGTDVSGSLTYSATNLPTGLSVNSSTGLISGTVGLSAHVSSPFAVSVSAHDSSYSATQTLAWNVTPEVALLYPGPQSNAGGDGVSLALTGGSASGTLSFSATGLPTLLTINSSTGLITGTIAPFAVQSTPYLVTVIAGDGTAHSTTSFDWTVATLEMAQPADQSKLDSDTVSLALGAHYHGTSALTYSASDLPTGATLNTSTGVITGTLATTADLSAGEVSVTATAGSNTVSQMFFWDVEPRVSIDSLSDQSNVVGDTVSLAISATDAASGSLTYSATGLPAGLSVNSSSGLISGTISASAVSSTPDSVTLTVGDGTLNVKQTLNWSVAAVGLAVQDTQQRVQNHSASLTMDGWTADGGAVTYSATALPAGMSINVSTGVISGTPTTVGDALAVVTAGEGTHSTSQYFEWDVVEVGAPNPGDQTSQEGNTISLTLHGGSGSTISPTYSATGLPDGLSINSGTGVISGILPAGASADGPFYVEVAVADATQASQQTFNWTVNPWINVSSVADQTNVEGNVVSLSVSATDAGTLSMTYSATGLPGGLSINSSSGLISGTVSTGDALAGPAAVTVSVTDGTYSSDQFFGWSLTPASAPAAPSMTSMGMKSNQTGDEVSLQINASDAASYTLTYSATNLPDGLTIDPSLGLISGTVADDAASTTPYNVTVTAEDGVGETTNMSFTWLTNPSPVSVSLSSFTAVAGNDPGSITLGTITTPDMNTQAGDFVVNVNWGDGTTDDAGVTGDNGTFTITDDHVYETTGTLSAVVSVTDAATGGLITTSNSPTVSAASWTLTGGFVEGAILNQSTGVVVGTIQDSDPDITASAFAVSVIPGDGSSAVSATLTSVGPGEWDVVLSHSYTQVGADTAAVTVTGPGGTSHTTNSTADAGQVYAGVPVIMTAGEYVVLNPASTSGDTVSIIQGDGTTISGSIIGTGPSLSVQGTLTYTQSSIGQSGNTYSVSQTVQNGTQSLTTGNTAVGVAPSSLALQLNHLDEDDNGTVSGQIVANFEDSNLNDTSGSFSVSINWGDGNSSAGSITGSNGLFTISACHSFTPPADQVFEVVLCQDNGTGTLISGSDTISLITTVADAVPDLTATKVGQVTGPGGFFAYGITWKLTKPSKPGGFIIQHVTTSLGWDYYEAWQVAAGQDAPARMTADQQKQFLAQVNTESDWFAQLTLPYKGLNGRLDAYINARIIEYKKTGKLIAKSDDIYMAIPSEADRLKAGKVTFTGEAFFMQVDSLPSIFKPGNMGGDSHSGTLQSVTTAGNAGEIKQWLTDNKDNQSKTIQHTLTATWKAADLPKVIINRDDIRKWIAEMNKTIPVLKTNP